MSRFLLLAALGVLLLCAALAPARLHAQETFEQFEPYVDADVKAAAPQMSIAA